MAATFNRQLHTAEIRALEQKAAELDGVDGKSAAEWKEALGREALRRVDAAYAAALGEADPSAAQYLDALAAAFAAETGSTGFVDAMGSQLNFLARDAQFENYAYLATEIKADAAFYDIVLADYAAPGGDALGDLLSPSDRLRADALSAASVSALVGGAEPSTLTTEQQIARNLTLQEAALQARELSLELIALDATLESQLEVARAQFDTAEIRTLEAQRSELNDRIGDLFTTSGAVQWRFTADFAVGFASGASETAQATYETILGGIAALNQYMIDQGGVLIGDENALANNRARTDALVGLLARGVDNLAHIDELPQALIDGTLGAFSALAESLAEINTAYHNADYEAIGVLSEQIAVTAATELIPAIRAGDKASDIADLADLARIGGGRAPEFEVPNSVAGSFDGAGGIWNRNSPLQVEYFPSGSVVGKGNQPLCGPASCTMIVRDRTGDTVDLGAITNQFNGVRTTGVNGVEMSTVLSNNGIDNQFISSMNSTQLNSVLDSNQPVIVNVRAGEGGHWIVVDSRIEVDGQSYYNVRDPNAGSGAGGGYGVQTDFLISNWNGGNAIVID
ncbi:MAG: papain-like cysteine protease family protein [Alphaproteobacteria bacterium]|nr:papain-like cysteine protease family protein [Alphaproteobacteria bacterium]